MEEAFRTLKGDLAIRPIHHQEPERIEAHIFIAFLAYCLHVTVGLRLKGLAPGLTPRSLFEKFSAVQMIDVHIPTTDGRELQLTRYTQPEPELMLLLKRLKLELPDQPPPKITAAQAAAKPSPRSADLQASAPAFLNAFIIPVDANRLSSANCAVTKPSDSPARQSASYASLTQVTSAITATSERHRNAGEWGSDVVGSDVHTASIGGLDLQVRLFSFRPFELLRSEHGDGCDYIR